MLAASVPKRAFQLQELRELYLPGSGSAFVSTALSLGAQFQHPFEGSTKLCWRNLQGEVISACGTVTCVWLKPLPFNKGKNGLFSSISITNVV